MAPNPAQRDPHGAPDADAALAPAAAAASSTSSTSRAARPCRGDARHRRRERRRPDLHAQAVAADVPGQAAPTSARCRSRSTGSTGAGRAPFYGQPPDATVFVVSQLADGTSHVRFGDGIERRAAADRQPGRGHLPLRRGRREPAGRAADDDPAAAAQPRLGPQPGRGLGRRRRRAARRRPVNAPASVLTFGRAISADDYETVAAPAPGVAGPARTGPGTRSAAHARQGLRRRRPAAAAARPAPRWPAPRTPTGRSRGATGDAIGLTLSCTLVIAADRVAADVRGRRAVGRRRPRHRPLQPREYGDRRSAVLEPDRERRCWSTARLRSTGSASLAGGAQLFAEPVGWADPGEGGFYMLDQRHDHAGASNG